MLDNPTRHRMEVLYALSESECVTVFSCIRNSVKTITFPRNNLTWFWQSSQLSNVKKKEKESVNCDCSG